jgi:hypothetical protein
LVSLTLKGKALVGSLGSGRGCVGAGHATRGGSKAELKISKAKVRRMHRNLTARSDA